ncbi:MAG: hypothetical protein HOP30_17180 [Cyclobacteriaceae bacterium]|nr:hypothetical protein [Cyclobacteriaceae bacterium]
MKQIWIYIGLLVTFGSCAKQKVSEEELKKYIRDVDNGLRQSIKAGEFAVEATYQPTDLFVLRELGSSKADTASLNKWHKKYGGHYYFILSISKNGKEAITPTQMPYDEFSDLLQTVSFRLGEYINMTTAKQDTIPLADFIYNRTFGMATGSDILMVFDKKKAAQTDWVQINLKELGLGLGTQNFRFDRERLDEAPEIDFNRAN